MLNKIYRKEFIVDFLTSLLILTMIYIIICVLISRYVISDKQNAMLSSGYALMDHTVSIHNSNEICPDIFLHNLAAIIPSDIDIFFFDNEGLLYCDNVENENSLNSHYLDEKTYDLLAKGDVVKQIKYTTNLFKEASIIVVIPYDKAETLDGGILLCVALIPILKYLIRIFFSIYLVVIVMLILLIYTSKRYKYTTVSSLAIINEVSKEIANGNLSSRVDTTALSQDIQLLGENMNHMASELEETDNIRKNFIANISHDFRTPLTSINGFVQAMLDGTIPVENQKKYLNIVLEESNRLTHMTNSILLLSKMESHNFALTLNSFDIHHVIRRVLIQFEQPIKDKNLNISFRLEGHELFVVADYNQIQRVIYNLLDNAIKFCPPNKSISIDTKIQHHKVYISVIDTGRGIAKENLKHIWSRFHKDDSSRGEDKSGIGIGLSIVHEIIKAHGESITVTSKKGKGTNFTFTLPLSKEVN